MNRCSILPIALVSLLALACADSATGPTNDAPIDALSSGPELCVDRVFDVENIALNFSALGYPHPLESSVGYGSSSDLWFMVDDIISPVPSMQGVAFNEDSQWGNLTIDFGDISTFSQLNVWSEYAEFWDHVEDKTVEYWDGEGWIEITGGSWSLEWRWMREGVEMTTSSTDWSPTYVADEYNYPRTASIYSFEPVYGSKIRVRGRTQKWFWMYEIEVYGLEGIAVDIDIRPGTNRNIIVTNRWSRIPVVVKTAGSFDAATIDLGTVTLGDGDGDDTPIATRRNGSRMARLHDIDGDGDRDLILLFKTRALKSNGDLDRNMTELILTGETVDGAAIKGIDHVRIVTPNGWWH